MVVEGTEMVRSLGGRINRGSSEEDGDGDGGEQRRMRRSSRKKGNTREKREKNMGDMRVEEREVG